MIETRPFIDLSSRKGSFRDTQYYGEDVEARRWWVLLTFSLYSSISNFATVSFNSTGGPSMQYLNIDEGGLLILTEINLISVPIFSYFGAWYAHKRFKETLMICMIITAIGCWIRVFTGSDFNWVIISQVLISVGSSPVFGIAMMIAERWFPVRERFAALNVSVFSNNFGLVVAYILPPLMVGDDTSKMYNYVCLQAFGMTIPVVMGFFAITKRPRIPPSHTALVKLIDPSSFIEEMKSLISKPKFWPFAIVFGILLANSLSTMAVSGIVTRKFNFPNLYQSILGTCYVGIGILAGAVATLYLARRRSLRYDPIIKFLVTTSFITLIITELLLNFFDNLGFALIIICHILIGIGLIGVTPFLFDSLTESTFPVQESVSGNALYVVQSAITIFINRVQLLPIVATHGFAMLALFVFPCWLYVMFLFKTDKKREKVDTLYTEIDVHTKRSLERLERKEKIPLGDFKDFVHTLENLD